MPAAKAEQTALKDYVVVTHALVMKTGRLRNDVTRFARGAILRLDPEHATTKFFLRYKSIVEHNPEKTPPQATPRIVAKAFGAEADPVKLPTDLPASQSDIAANQ